MKEYEYWKQTISAVETYTIDQKTAFSPAVSDGMWMDYYQTVGNEERYVELCLAHAVICISAMKAIDAYDRAATIDIKVQRGKRGRSASARGNYVCGGVLTGLGTAILLSVRPGAYA